MRTLFQPLGITRLANVTGLDHVGIPVTMVCRPNSRSLAVSQGKGADLDAARASGIMEAIELYHAERITSPLKLASWNELRFSHTLASVELLPCINESRFHPDQALLWIEGVDLLRSVRAWLPFELVHTNFTLPFPSGSGCFVMSSNGLASGNHMLEAIRHGLCEVIERDAAALFRLRPLEEQDERRVDLSTVDDPECLRLLAAYSRAEVAVAVWDMTSDVRVPAFRCIILERSPSAWRALGPAEGAGCHPAREVALSRALTEAAQARLTLIAGARDDNGIAAYEEVQAPALTERARQRLERPARRPFRTSPTTDSQTLEQHVRFILATLADAGLREAVVIDLSKPELRIPVARVVVPGLEPYHHIEGYSPGPRALRLLQGLRSKADR